MFLVMQGINLIGDFIRRVCKYLGSGLKTLDLEFSAITDEHLEKVSFPESLTDLNLNGCREISEKTLVLLSQKCRNLKRIGKNLTMI